MRCEPYSVNKLKPSEILCTIIYHHIKAPHFIWNASLSLRTTHFKAGKIFMTKNSNFHTFVRGNKPSDIWGRLAKNLSFSFVFIAISTVGLRTEKTTKMAVLKGPKLRYSVYLIPCLYRRIFHRNRPWANMNERKVCVCASHEYNSAAGLTCLQGPVNSEDLQELAWMFS